MKKIPNMPVNLVASEQKIDIGHALRERRKTWGKQESKTREILYFG